MVEYLIVSLHYVPTILMSLENKLILLETLEAGEINNFSVVE